MRVKLFSQLSMVGWADLGSRSSPPKAIIWGNRTFLIEANLRDGAPTYYWEIDALHIAGIELERPAGAVPITPSFRQEDA